jgi:hypothetical protein
MELYVERNEGMAKRSKISGKTKATTEIIRVVRKYFRVRSTEKKIASTLFESASRDCFISSSFIILIVSNFFNKNEDTPKTKVASE